MIIRVDFNDEGDCGVAHEYDTCPSYDKNVTNTHARTCTRAQREREREKYIVGRNCAMAQSSRVQGATKLVEN
jgi:hypothetical protein